MPGGDQREHARWLRIPLVDGHNDLPWELREQFAGDLSRVDLAQSSPSLHTDLPRLDTGGVAGQFWSVYVPPMSPGAAVVTVLEQIDLVYRLVARYPHRMEIARGAGDVERCMAKGRLASLLGAEGGHVIGSSLIGQDFAKKTLAVAVHNHYKRITIGNANRSKTEISLNANSDGRARQSALVVREGAVPGENT